MNLQINLNTPTPNSLLKQPQIDLEVDEFELNGTWDEIFLLGQQVSIAVIQAIQYQAVDPMDDWASLELVHLHATRDHIVLLDPEMLQIRPEEEEQLRASVQEVLDHYLLNTVIPTGSSWLFCTNEFNSLKTSSVELAKGRNMDVWMAKDTDKVGVAKKWRQMQNEIQMIWHDHPVNLARDERGELPVNSVWLHGVGSLSHIQPHQLIKFSRELHGESQILANLAQFLNKPFHRLNAKAIAELEAGTHFIDGRNQVSPEKWESIWQACLKLLHQGQLTSIQFTTEHLGNTLTSSIQQSDFKVNFMQNLFFKKQSIQQKFPSWNSFAGKINWQPE
jgi:hypothetical protein